MSITPQFQDSPARLALATPVHDIAIIGAGGAGTAAAAAFSRQGHSVVLIDAHHRHPVDFRAEKIGQQQLDYLDSFGLGAAARGVMTSFDGVWVHRFGRIIEKKTTREFAGHYEDFVNGLRDGLPDGVKMVIGRVENVAAAADRQDIELADGRRFTARLLVVATGLGDAVKRKLGLERETISAGHSLAFGFDLDNARKDFPFSSLVYTSEAPRHQAAYLTLFPIGDRMRANLFAYRQVNDPWTHAFRKDPVAGLREMMPDFEQRFTPLRATGHVTARPIDLTRVKGHERPGVVLIGDAFFTVCPSSGTGIDKALHDVERLSAHLPGWLATPGMSLEKIRQFYHDPLKRAHDAHALNISLRARAMRMEHGLSWRARRLRSAVLVRTLYGIRDLARPAAQRA